MKKGLTSRQPYGILKIVKEREMVRMEKKIIAGWTLSNFGGVGVLEMDGDSMLVQYYDNEPEQVEIQYEYEDEAEEIEDWADYPRAYVKVGQIQLYLDECMKY
jgi:hypothetical protein